jgi:hypothetical protein
MQPLKEARRATGGEATPAKKARRPCLIGERPGCAKRAQETTGAPSATARNKAATSWGRALRSRRAEGGPEWAAPNTPRPSPRRTRSHASGNSLRAFSTWEDTRKVAVPEVYAGSRARPRPSRGAPRHLAQKRPPHRGGRSHVRTSASTSSSSRTVKSPSTNGSSRARVTEPRVYLVSLGLSAARRRSRRCAR